MFRFVIAIVVILFASTALASAQVRPGLAQIESRNPAPPQPDDLETRLCQIQGAYATERSIVFLCRQPRTAGNPTNMDYSVVFMPAGSGGSASFLSDVLANFVASGTTNGTIYRVRVTAPSDAMLQECAIVLPSSGVRNRFAECLRGAAFGYGTDGGLIRF
jgi:hypothetical protein